MLSASQQLSQRQPRKSRESPRPKREGKRRSKGTHIQVVGEDHRGRAVAEGESLGELASLMPEPGHIHAALLQAFPD